MYPQPIQNLIDRLAKLPSVGNKTAERLVFHLLKSPPENLTALSAALDELKNKITRCDSCHSFSTQNPCAICADPRRDKNLLCIIAKPQDIAVIEKSGAYAGLYYVLTGNFNPLQNPNDAAIAELLQKIAASKPQEVILALNPDMEGETILLYLNKALKQFPNLKITRLARGLPMGADLEYADEITLENALLGRQNIK